MGRRCRGSAFAVTRGSRSIGWERSLAKRPLSRERGNGHLVRWDAGDPECLLQLVKELIQQYHHYQCQRLRDSSRLLFEYDSLLEEPSYGHNMEVYAGRKNSWTGEFSARFLLKLPVDFSNIPVYLLKAHSSYNGLWPSAARFHQSPRLCFGMGRML
ncbi:unnamed protein product [Boreogadus saida]